ncbi:MAG: chemotaxis protein CheA [Chloroflexota bacterium]|nr:chemotaxis protein CheA [Chloroflexota bacterium]
MTENMPEIDLSQFRSLFIDEGEEHVHTLNQCMLTLERAPADADALEAMFRAAHSLKGASATMGYDTLATLAHATEDVLHKVRSGDWAMRPELVELLFMAIDTLQALMNGVTAGDTELTLSEAEREADVTSVLEQLRGYEQRASGQAGKSARGQVAEDKEKVASDKSPPPTPYSPLSTYSSTMIRVDVHHLDALLNVVTEMVIHRSLLTRLGHRYDLEPLNEALQVHDRLLAQLQGAVLKMRMVPVGHVFGRFPRMVRDLLKAEGKKAQLVIEGEDVELDRTALETLGDPLVHLLRNAVDHGLERPAEREAAGKSPSGTLRLSAQRERGMVVIKVSDDGRGMNPSHIAAAAVERGVVTAEMAAEMNEGQILELICHPGFSLSEKVTAVSGRGVGMNVVKQQLETLRGSLQIETQVGQGSTFRLQLPAMLALVRALLVGVGSEQYALPSDHVERIIDISDLDPARIERIGDQELLHLEEGLLSSQGETGGIGLPSSREEMEEVHKVLPLRRLGKLVYAPGCASQPRHALVVRRNGQPFGLRVDDVMGHEEIVVKPLPAALHGMPGLAGVTILGEGQVVLILDVMGL